MASERKRFVHRTDTDAINANASEAQWSPDGSQIVFQAYFNLTDPVNGSASVTNNVWLMDANGVDLDALTHFTQPAAENATF